MNASSMMTQGNLALQYEDTYRPQLSVVMGGQASTLIQRRPSKPVIVLALSVIVFSLAFFGINLATKQQTISAAYENIHFEQVKVSDGDSLWSLAEEHRAEGLTTQETSDLIRSANHLSHAGLKAGSYLKVPVSH